ncbi:four helix bundle protein [Flavobacteriaceae bacterium 3-367]
MVDYRNYLVWQKSDQLVLDVYPITKRFPKDERFNLVSKELNFMSDDIFKDLSSKIVQIKKCSPP